MSGWYWLLWAALTVGNVALFVGSLRHMRESARLLSAAESAVAA